MVARKINVDTPFLYFSMLFQETCSYFFRLVLQKDADTVLHKDTDTCARDMVRPNSLWTSVYSCDLLETLLNICAFVMFPSVSYAGSMLVSMHACSISYCNRDLYNMRGNKHACVTVLWIHVCRLHIAYCTLHIAYKVASTYAMHTRTHIQTG